MADDLPNWNQNILDPMDDDFKFKFIDVSSVDELFAQQENENMKKKTTYDLNIVLKFLREYGKKGENKRKSHRRELNLYLSEFIIAGKTKKGEQYEPSSLKRRSYQALTALSHNTRIWEKIHCSQIYEIGRCIEKGTEKKGPVNKPNATTALSEEEIDFFFKKRSWEQILYNRY